MAPSSTTISLSDSPAAELAADTLVIGVAKGEAGPQLVTSAAAARGLRNLAASLKALGATGTAEEVTRVPAQGEVAASVILAVGLGKAARRYDPNTLRNAAGAAARTLNGTKKAVFALPAKTPAEVSAVAEGALLGSYTFRGIRKTSAQANKPGVATVVIATELARSAELRAALAHARTVAQAVNLARDLVNTPASHLHPKDLAAAAVAAATGTPVTVEVMDEKALKRGGFGGIIGVGQGSVNPPRLVRMQYRHPKARAHLAIVGKGITFDSGGISIKPALGMDTMKGDMGGAAATIAAVTAVARLGLPINVTGWAPMAENMPSGSAQRPSDVLTILGGTTVEVLNTDAEGRLILADALVAAGREKPDVIVDVATLTGAQLIALGPRICGLMSNDDDLREQIFHAATQVGEQMWPMPLPAEMRKTFDSPVADMANISDRSGGMIAAGVFLQEFVEPGQRWVHLDIAGPSFNKSAPYGSTPRGATGVAVRTLVRLAETMAGDATSG